MADYYTLLTNDGLAYETARKAAGLPIKLTKMSVGDGNGAVYNPEATATALRREVWRGDINALLQDPNNSSWLIAELTIPDSVGGWYVREAGIWTDTGVLYAVVKYPESFKPVLATSGSGKEFYLRAIFQTSNAASVTLQVDETVVKATRAWVTDFVAGELAKRDAKQSARVATVGPITLSGAQTIDGVAVVAGDRVLVKNQAAASANGLYVAAVGAWTRSVDADTSAKVTPGLLVAIEEGAANADTLWQLVTDGAIVLGTTALTFVSFYNGTQIAAMLALKANLESPTFTGDPKAPTPARFDNDTSLATTEFAKAMGLEFSAVKDVTAAGAALAAEDAGKVVRVNLAATGAVVLPALSGLPAAAALLLKNVSASSLVTVTPAAADTLPQPLTLPPLCSALLVARPGASAWLVVGGAAEAFAAVSSNVIGQLGLRNRLINPSFYYWQRGASRTLSSQTLLVADRFIANSGNGGVCTIARTAHIAGNGLGTQYLSWQQTTAPATNPLLTQRIESVRTLEGRKAAFSLYGSGSVPLACLVTIRQYFGTGGNPSAMLDTPVGSFTFPTNWARLSLVFDIPSISGKTIGNNGDDFVEILVSLPSGITFSMTTWDWQLEEGAVATPFEVRPLALELALCQRYYETAGFNCSFWAGAGGQSTFSTQPFKVQKRSVPTLVISNASSSNASAVVAGDVSTVKFSAGATSSGAGVQVNASFGWAADSEL